MNNGDLLHIKRDGNSLRLVQKGGDLVIHDAPQIDDLELKKTEFALKKRDLLMDYFDMAKIASEAGESGEDEIAGALGLAGDEDIDDDHLDEIDSEEREPD